MTFSIRIRPITPVISSFVISFLHQTEVIIEICGGYQKLGLTPITEQSSKSAVVRQQHFKSEKEDKKEALQSSGKTITEHMITNFICKDYKMPSKKSEEKTGTTNYSSTNQNIIPPQTTPRVQLKKTQVNER